MPGTEPRYSSKKSKLLTDEDTSPSLRNDTLNYFGHQCQTHVLMTSLTTVFVLKTRSPEELPVVTNKMTVLMSCGALEFLF